jgi:hypothetical protein
MPERPAFAAMDGACKRPGKGGVCVGGGAAIWLRTRNKEHRD